MPEDLRERMAAALNDSEDGCARCQHCDRQLDAAVHGADEHRPLALRDRAWQAEAERDALKDELREWATLLAHGTGMVPAVDIAWKLRQLAKSAPESNADAPSPVTAATEAHGETTEAQEG